MQTDTIVHGETYGISIQIQGANEEDTPIDNTWQVACRITSQTIGGTIVAEPIMVIQDGVASCSIDTGDAPWVPTTYYYDIRITDPDGNDYWTEPVQLILRRRNTPAS